MRVGEKHMLVPALSRGTERVEGDFTERVEVRHTAVLGSAGATPHPSLRVGRGGGLGLWCRHVSSAV